MIEMREGLTDRFHLADTVLKNSSLQFEMDNALLIIDKYIERCVEGYLNGKLAGYFLVLNINGVRSFHAYKLVNGYSFAAFKISKRLIKDYKDICITTTTDKVQVNRIARLLGFKETICVKNIVKLER